MASQFETMPIADTNSQNIHICICIQPFLLNRIYLYSYSAFFVNSNIFLFVFVLNMGTKYICICMSQEKFMQINNFFQMCMILHISSQFCKLYNKLAILYIHAHSLIQVQCVNYICFHIHMYKYQSEYFIYIHICPFLCLYL